MRKVLSFSLFLMLGLVASQLLPGALGTAYPGFKATADTLLYICLGFIMINVGREFEIDKSRWRSYTADYFIAMATAALPWLLIVLYYIFVLLPSDLWTDSAAWKENLLLSRFAAPTSAGILFTMLAALSLKNSWIYRKIQVLAIFDDLDTILLMIPLQILMIGLKWQMFAIVGVVVVLLIAGWRWQARWNVRQDWKRILGLSAVVCALTQALYIVTARWYGPENSIHIEVLLPAFVIGMLMKHREIDTPTERRAATGISFLFMLLVGMSMPLVTGASAADAAAAATSITASQPMMPWGVLILHVVAVSALSNIGKLVPVFFYRDRKLSERLALSIGMFTRGEVGAGVIFIALGYSLGGPALIIFSNEAGMGSAPNVAATAHVSHPVKQGLIQALGVFTDTLIICTCTAFIILFSGAPLDGSINGVQLTQQALSNEVGSIGSTFVALAILLFAFSSIIGNYYYGEANIRFITSKRSVLFIYRILVGGMVMFGALASLDLAWSLADVTMGLMTICNLIAISLLSRQAFLLLQDYVAQKKAGIKSPVFDKNKIPELKDKAQCW